ncbi:MAG: TolC family outer membrane protein [Pseudomonadota bacterium]
MITVAVVGLLVGGPVWAQSLEEELAYLLETNPRLAGTQKTLLAAQEGERKAFGAFLPTITLDGDTGYERIDSPSRRQVQGEPSSLVRDKVTLTVTQNLFDGRRRISNYDGSKVNTNIQEIAVEGSGQQLMFEGIAAYIDVLRTSQLVRLARSNEETVQRQLQLETERVERGVAITVDELQAKARLQLAKERRVAFEGQLLDSLAKYLQVFGRAPNPDTMADPLAPIHLVPASLEEAAKMAQDGNPQIKSSARQIDLADTRRGVAESEFYPRIDLVGKANTERDVDATRGQRRDFSVLMKATWELFSGFSTRAAVAEAAYQVEAAKDNLAFANRKVVEETRLAWNEMTIARERVVLLENAVSIATAVFEARERLRAAGRETALNVLDAENELYNARINFTLAAFDGRRAVYRLVFAMGQLSLDALRAQPAPPPVVEPETAPPPAEEPRPPDR